MLFSLIVLKSPNNWFPCSCSCSSTRYHPQSSQIPLLNLLYCAISQLSKELQCFPNIFSTHVNFLTRSIMYYMTPLATIFSFLSPKYTRLFSSPELRNLIVLLGTFFPTSDRANTISAFKTQLKYHSSNTLYFYVQDIQ